MRITIHETYEYEVEAASADEALELFDKYREMTNEKEAELTTGVSFNQNYLHTYDSDMNEI
jgi:hypothetical protein